MFVQTLAVFRLLDADVVKPVAAFRVPNKALAVRSCFCPLAPASRDGSCLVSGSESCQVQHSMAYFEFQSF
jgi:hypothetical protein